jgi:hypothetical protein
MIRKVRTEDIVMLMACERILNDLLDKQSQVTAWHYLKKRSK